MGYIYTAVVRDKAGKIITYGDYAEYQSPPENITQLASQPGNTLSTTVRKEGKGQYFDYAGELASRQTQLRAENENLLAQRESAVSQANVKARQIAQTTNNPFVSQGAREITRRKAIPTFQNLSDIQSKIESNSIILNDLIPGTTIQKTASSKAKVDENKLYAEKRAEADKSAYQTRNLQSTQADLIVGDKAYDIPDAPKNMTREQTDAYNKGLIKAQQDILRVTGKTDVKQESYEEIPKTVTQPIPETKEPDRSLVSPYLGSTYWQVGDKTFTTKSDAEKYAQSTGVTKYTITSPDGKERTFATKEAAEKFSSRYGNIQPESVIIPGSLTSIYGEKPKVQGPNISDSAFFVGANAQGYVIDTTRKIEPRITYQDLFGSNEYTRRLDKIYELNKPVSERSDVSRVGIGGFSNREIGELTAPLLNRLAEAKDTITATGKALQGQKAFQWESGFLGVPVYAPIQKSQKIETSLDRLASGKPVDLSNKNERYSLYGSTLTFAGELYGFGVGVKGGTKAVEAAGLYQKTGAFTKSGAVKKAQSLLSEGLISGATKIDDNYYIIARGGGNKGTGISTEVKPTLSFEKVNGVVTTRFSKTPKEVNVLQSGEKVAQEVAKIDKEIEKLKVFTDKNRFNESLVQKTEQKILALEKKRDALQSKPTLTTGEAKYPVSIIEFGETPKVTQIGKAQPIEKVKVGSTIFVEGTVPRQQVREFGLTELPKTASAEFGIAVKPGQTNAIYQGIVTETNLPKLIAAEKLGYIKTLAEGRTAPLEALLKGKIDKFSFKTFRKEPEIFDPFKISKTKKPDEEFDFFYHGTESNNIKNILEKGLFDNSFLADRLSFSKKYSQLVKDGVIIEYKIPRTAKKADIGNFIKDDEYKIIAERGLDSNLIGTRAKQAGYDIATNLGFKEGEYILANPKIAIPTRIIYTSNDKLISKIIGEKETKNIFDIFKRTPKQPEKIEPEISIFSKTKPDEIRTPTEFGIVNKGKIKPGETRGITGIGSKSLENFAQETFKPLSEKAATKSKPFNFGIGEGKGIGGSSGKGASLSLDDAFGAAKSYVASKPVAPQDILFSPPRFLAPQYHGEISDSILAYPYGTPEKIKSQIKIDTGLDTRIRLQTSQSGEATPFVKFGLETIKQTKKEFEKQNEINVFIQSPKEKQGTKGIVTPIIGLGLTPIIGTGLTHVQGLKQTPITMPITELTTVPVTEYPPITKGTPPFTPPGFRLGVFGTAFPGFGFEYDDRKKRKKGKKKYIVSSIDPLTPGSIETAGVKQQQVSSRKSIYGRLDIQLGKARRKNQPKEKKFKDPFRL